MTKQQLEWEAEAKDWFKKYVAKNQLNQDNLTTLSAEQLDVISKATSASTITICQNQKIPSGFVIVGQTTNFNCSYDLDNAWIIKRPAEQEVICKISPIPMGYVIVGQTTHFQCSHDLKNAWIIKIPEKEEVVCKASPIPEGYVIVAQTTDFSCSTDLTNAWVIKLL